MAEIVLNQAIIMFIIILVGALCFKLKLLSKEFNVSINTLLGSPRTLYCQCCGMPLSEDSMISREPDGSFNEDYCQWCYADGEFTYETKDSLLQTTPSPS